MTKGLKMISVSTESYKSVEELLQVDTLLNGVADYIHCDVMDGKFVERSLFNYNDLKVFAEKAKMPLDIHLMCENLKQKYDDYILLKPEILTIHYEAFKTEEELIYWLSYIKQNNIKAGLSIKPQTNVSEIVNLLSIVDLVLVMSVEIGYGGQKFMPSSLEKIDQLKKNKTKNNFNYIIEVDGGINFENAKQIFDSGADMLVSGSFVANHTNKIMAIEQLKKW